MKLKTLDIENIASFEKASVDFDNGPLGNADIFLINGETGSGKSTLLDAICLARHIAFPQFTRAKPFVFSLFFHVVLLPVQASPSFLYHILHLGYRIHNISFIDD